MLVSISFLLTLAVVIGVGCIIALEKIKRKDKEADRINKIMELLTNKGTSIKKTYIMDKLNIKPKVLSQTLKIMVKNGFVLETKTSIKITKFGKHHSKNFVVSGI
jgi:predicted transcriptional regulator